MKKRHYIRSLTHKTDYAKDSPYFFDYYGQLYENLGLVYNTTTVAGREPGSRYVHLFDSSKVDFSFYVGSMPLYFHDQFFCCRVLEVIYKDGQLSYRIHIFDDRWKNPVRNFVVGDDDLFSLAEAFPI